MKRFTGLVVALLCLSATAANAASTIEVFERKVGKFAAQSDGAAKSLCVCQDGGAEHGTVGILVLERDVAPFTLDSSGFLQGDRIRVTCAPQVFFGESQLSEGSCDTFAVLTK